MMKHLKVNLIFVLYGLLICGCKPNTISDPSAPGGPESLAPSFLSGLESVPVDQMAKYLHDHADEKAYISENPRYQMRYQQIMREKTTTRH
jgi:hypothetical protein